MLQNFLHPGQVDPRSLASGARGPHARPAWPSQPWPWRQWPGTKEGDAPAREEEGKGFLPDQGLTRRPPVCLVWPERVGRRRILRRRRSGPARESAMVATTPDVSAQFLAQEEQGGGGGASQLIGGGWCGAERRG
jgi:hypothetical protein